MAMYKIDVSIELFVFSLHFKCLLLSFSSSRQKWNDTHTKKRAAAHSNSQTDRESEWVLGDWARGQINKYTGGDFTFRTIALLTRHADWMNIHHLDLHLCQQQRQRLVSFAKWHWCRSHTTNYQEKNDKSTCVKMIEFVVLFFLFVVCTIVHSDVY